MSALLTIVPLWTRWLILAAIVSTVAIVSYVKGDAHGTQKLIDYQGRQAVESNRIMQARTVVNTQVVDHYVKVKGDTETVTKEVAHDVIQYVDKNTGLCLDADWRRVHDAAALNTLPAAGQRPDDFLRASAAFCPTAQDRRQPRKRWRR